MGTRKFRTGRKPAKEFTVRNFRLAKMVCIVAALCAASAISSPAQTLTVLANFGVNSGSSPQGPLAQGVDGNLYGATTFGGSGTLSIGSIFDVTPGGELTTVYNFCSKKHCNDGSEPNSGLLLAADGNFYGLASSSGLYGNGTMFRLTPAGNLTTIYNFCSQTNCADGGYPERWLAQGTNGFYGVTGGWGAYGFGTVFVINQAGTLTTLHSFCPSRDGSNCPDGRNPQGGLIQASNGNFYGTTNEGGVNGYQGGTIFEITPAGQLTTLYSFCSKANCADGATPNGLMQAANGNFYGATYAGGTTGCNGNGCGTIFEMTAAGKLTTLYTFCKKSGCVDGWGPSTISQGTDGNLYGTSVGGTFGQGTIFRITPSGEFTSLYNFCTSETSCPEGRLPETGVSQATDGNFYGTTVADGAYGYGTVFSLSMGLGPFVKTAPAAARIGTKIIILGNNLTGTTSVSFNGTAAAFTVASDTEITATVPGGATTGTVQVVTLGGTLNSNVSFRVTK
jgi:uncharacterized repeat protein (TIGR03803 family)